jgi:hypothetical protein
MSHKPFEFVPGMPEGATAFVAGKIRHPSEVDEFIVDEARGKRIQDKYQRLVDHGLYEDNDLRSFANGLWNAIVHFDDKTLYVFTYPIISASPACYIKTCACGTVVFKELLDDADFKGVLDLEDVLDAIQETLDFDGDDRYISLPLPTKGFNGVNVDIDGSGDPIPFYPTYLKQPKEAD